MVGEGMAIRDKSLLTMDKKEVYTTFETEHYGFGRTQ